MTNPEKAAEMYDCGYNCAQTVISIYFEKYRLNKKIALNIAGGFGAGIAQMQETCGAVTGAAMVLGLDAGEKNDDALIAKEFAAEAIIEFVKRFKERNGSVNCRELLNCDINTDEGIYFYDVNELHDKVCIKCIKDAVGIIDDLIQSKPE